MRTVEIAVSRGGCWLHIPDGWDVFVFHGYLYVMVDDMCHCVEELPK